MSATQTASAAGVDLRQSQLLLDDTWVADSVRLRRQWHQATKYPEPVLKSEYPWEYNCPVAYGSVLKRGDKFHMWYCGWTRGVQPQVCYAYSDDGVYWTRPVLGLFETCGTRENNVVLQAERPQRLIDDISVIEDLDDEQWPLKALFWESGNRQAQDVKGLPGIWAARSADGIHWERIGKVLPRWGDRFNAMAVKHRGKFILLGRAPDQRTFRGRVASYIESQDLLRWSEPELAVTTDLEDPPHMEIYSATCFPYAGLVLGSIERMHMSPDKLDTEIIWSRDARKWRRSRSRPRFIEWGVPGSWDDTWINLPSSGPILHQDRLWFYYSGRSAAHGAAYPHNHGAIGLATLRIDGFCSLYAAETSGWMLTPALTWPGGELMLNYDCRRDLSSHPHNIATGEVRVEVRDAENQPIEGHALADCTVLRGNSVRAADSAAAVKWGERSATNLAGKQVRLHIELRDAHLFSFRAQ